MEKKQLIQSAQLCYHCGEVVGTEGISADEKSFCCSGCRMVYEILAHAGMCDYYELDKNPGNQRRKIRSDQFAFLEEELSAQNYLASLKQKVVVQLNSGTTVFSLQR